MILQSNDFLFVCSSFASILITCCVGGGVAAPASHSIPEASFAVGEELPLQVRRKKLYFPMKLACWNIVTPLLSHFCVTSSQ